MKGPVLACTILFIRLKVKEPRGANLHGKNIQFLFHCARKSQRGCVVMSYVSLGNSTEIHFNHRLSFKNILLMSYLNLLFCDGENFGTCDPITGETVTTQRTWAKGMT